MTSLPTPPFVPAIPVAEPESIDFPIGWVLSNAASPLQFRALTDVARLKPQPDLLPALVYGFGPALRLAVQQEADGIWNRSMLAVPTPDAHDFAGVGTICAVRRMLELGWERDSPPLLSARRILFRLLAEDTDPNFLFDFAGDARDSDLRHRGRLILREAAAATLAQAGYEQDPRLRGCAHRMLQRVWEFLDSPLAEHPWIRIGNKHVLAPEASPPSIHLLAMLAYMPHFRVENQEFVDKLYQYLANQLPRQESQQLVGSHIVAQPHLVLGDVLASWSVAGHDVPFALYWLELVARLGVLRRNEHWSRLFERFLHERDRDGVWRPSRGDSALATTSPHAWAIYPLSPDQSAVGIAADVTVRLGIIARAAGRAIDLM